VKFLEKKKIVYSNIDKQLFVVFLFFIFLKIIDNISICKNYVLKFVVFLTSYYD